MPHLPPRRAAQRPPAARFSLPGLLLCLSLAPASRAEEIVFDEMPASNANCCFLSDEYSDLGVFFETTDDGSTWDGLSSETRDPGDWRVDGTAGPVFLGFNGSSYEATVVFDEPVVEFRMDVARAAGPPGFAELRVWGLRDGEIVERFVQELGAVNLWITASLDSEVDAVRWKVRGDGDARHYAVDHLRWELAAPPEPEELLVDVELLPFRRHKVLPATHRGVLGALVLGSAELDVKQLDPDSMTCGEASSPGGWLGPHYFDRNRDGFMDLFLGFRSRDVGLVEGPMELCVRGTTLEQTPFVGCDEIRVIEPRRRGMRMGRRR